MIEVPESDRSTKPKSRKVCPRCEASAAGCRSAHWLSGRWCCVACRGDHDAERTA